MKIEEALQEFLFTLEANGRSDQTITAYKSRVGRFTTSIRTQDLEKVQERHVLEWAVSLRRQNLKWRSHPTRPIVSGGLSIATIAGNVQAVKTFFNWCVNKGYLVASPAACVEKPHYDASAREKVCRLPNLQRMLDLAYHRAESGDPQHVRDLSILLFCTETAARPGEVANLTLADLRLGKPTRIDGGEYVYTATVDGKTGKGEVQFTTETARSLRRWIAKRPATDYNNLYVGCRTRHHGRPMTTSGIYQALGRLAAAAGVKENFGAQAIRHLNGQTYTDRGNLELARRKLRHRDVTTTAMFYAHQDDERLYKATVELGPLRTCLTKPQSHKP